MLDHGQDVSCLDLIVLPHAHLLDPPRDLGADHRLLLRFQVTLGTEQLLGFTRGHPLDQANGDFGLGSNPVVLAIADVTRSANNAQRDEPEHP